MKSKVFIVDDDREAVDSMKKLLELDGLEARVYYAAKDFISNISSQDHGCIILDLKMPQIDGLEVYKFLLERKIDTPVIFLTGHADVESARNSLKLGAFDFIQKPIMPDILLDVVHRAVDLDGRIKKEHEQFEDLEARLNRLSGREKQVASYIACGYTSKEIAKLLSVSPRTVEAHRARVMIKVRADCLAHLVSIVTLYNRLKLTKENVSLANMDESVFGASGGCGSRQSLGALSSG